MHLSAHVPLIGLHTTTEHQWDKFLNLHIYTLGFNSRKLDTQNPTGVCCAYTLSELSPALTVSSFPGNPVSKILNLNLTYDASCISPQSRNRITGWKNTPLLSRVSSNMSLPSHVEVTFGQRKTTVNPVTHCPQVMHSDTSWQTVTRDAVICIAVILCFDTVNSFNGICQNVGHK